MDVRTVEKICEQVFGRSGHGVGKLLAAELGVSTGTVSGMLNGKTISDRNARKLTDFYTAWLESNPGLTNVLAGIDERPAFETVGLVRDTTSGRVIPAGQVNPDLIGVAQPRDVGSDEDIILRIGKRFNVVDRMIDGMVEGIIRSLVVSGAPGVGKTFNIERRLDLYEQDFNLKIIKLKGGASPAGLYQALWSARENGIVMIDDCDSLLDDEQSLNLLKVALDSTQKRVVGWAKQSSWVFNPDLCKSDEQDRLLEKGLVPNNFEFHGQVIYITNRDFAGQVNHGKMGPHYAALMSRSVYVDLTLHTIRQRMVWMRHIFLSEMYQVKGLSLDAAEEIMEFVAENAARFHDLSLRMVGQVADFRKIGNDWRDLAEVTKMK